MIKTDNFISIFSSETSSLINRGISSQQFPFQASNTMESKSVEPKTMEPNTVEPNTPGPASQNNPSTKQPSSLPTRTSQQNIWIIFLNSFILSISNLFFSFGFVASIYYLTLSLSSLSRRDSVFWPYIGGIFAILVLISVVLMAATVVVTAKHVPNYDDMEQSSPINSAAKEWKFLLLLTSLANVVNYITNIIQYLDIDINEKKGCISSADYGLDIIMISYNVAIIIFSFQINKLNNVNIKRWPFYFLKKLTVTIAIGISGAVLCYETICDTFNTYKLINKVTYRECSFNSSLTNVSQTVNKYMNILAPLPSLLLIFILLPIAANLDVDKLIQDKLLYYISDEPEVRLNLEEEENNKRFDNNFDKVYLNNNLLNVLIAGGLLIFLSSFCGTVYDIVASTNTTRFTCVLYTMPIIPITICIFLSYNLLHHTVKGISFQTKSDVKYKCFQFLNWITLGGQLVNLINYIVTAVVCICHLRTDMASQYQIEHTFYVLIIFVNFVCLIQSLIQSTVLDWLLRLKCDDNINRQTAKYIFNYSWFIMAFNFGCAIHNHLMNSNETLFITYFKHNDMKYFYYILSILSYPFNTLYRIVGGVILIIFMTQLKLK